MPLQRPQVSGHSRRTFLKAGGTVLSAMAIEGSPAAGAVSNTPSTQVVGLMAGVQSYTLRAEPLEQALTIIRRDLGTRYVELFPHHLIGQEPATVMRLLDAANVQPWSYGVVSLDTDEAASRQVFELAAAYGMRNISCDPHPDALDSLDRLAEQYGVTVAIHPSGPGHRWGTTARLQEAFRGRNRRIGLCADTGHLIRASQDPLKVMRRFQERLHAIHLKDFARAADGSAWQDVAAGTANLDIDRLAKLLVNGRSSVPIFLEYEGVDALPSTRRSIDRLRSVFRQSVF